MFQSLRIALMATLMAVFVQIGATTPVRADLSADQVDQVWAAVKQETPEAVIAALRELFVADPAHAPEIAAAAVEFNPSLCHACALAAASAVPDHIFAVVKAMVGEAPECANDIIDGASEALPAFAEIISDVVAQAAVQAAAGPASGPVSSPSDTVNHGDEDRASPS